MVCLRLLLLHGANPVKKTTNGWSPMEIVDVLVESKNPKVRAPLRHA
jgi:hypothetical protein